MRLRFAALTEIHSRSVISSAIFGAFGSELTKRSVKIENETHGG
ncbi:MAG: hypothetical protein AAF414_01995 [Pseudomonadota bacterium]